MKNDMGVNKIIIRNKNDLHFVISGKCIEWDACLDLIMPISVPSSLRINFLFSGRIATIFFDWGRGLWYNNCLCSLRRKCFGIPFLRGIAVLKLIRCKHGTCQERCRDAIF